jgi:hypothetical protein
LAIDHLPKAGYTVVTMHRFLVSLMFFWCAFLGSTVGAYGQLLQCHGTSGSGDRQESAALRQAPHGAKRIGKHTLQINWAHGVRQLVDKGCDGEGIGGQCWEYCSYDATLHLHHIGHEDEDLFTGVLLDDKTGQLLPGGTSVIFSPDRKMYLSVSQWDGKELSDWKLYTRNGTLLWAGDSGLVGKSDEILAEFEDAKWPSSGELLTDYMDSKNNRVVLTLTRIADGKWEWVQRK